MKTIILVIVGLIFFIGGIFNSFNLLAKQKCLTSYENYNPQYSFITKCRITVDGVLTPVDIVRNIK